MAKQKKLVSLYNKWYNHYRQHNTIRDADELAAAEIRKFLECYKIKRGYPYGNPPRGASL